MEEDEIRWKKMEDFSERKFNKMENDNNNIFN